MSVDVLGRLGQRAIVERLDTAPQDDGMPATKDSFGDLAVEAPQTQTIVPPGYTKPTVEPAAASETPARRRIGEKNQVDDTIAPRLHMEPGPAEIVPATEIATRRLDPRLVPSNLPAMEHRDKSAPVVPHAELRIDVPSIATGDPTGVAPANDEPALTAPVVRPRAEKTLAVDTANELALRRKQNDTAANEEEETVVNVHIGRIEVRAPQTPQPVTRPQPQRSKTSPPSLERYLAARSRSRG